jgi:putative Mg2+ transporter-C (MgtC) family protein
MEASAQEDHAMFDGWEAQAAVVARIAFAMLLGGVIGLEHEMKDRPAGFRTHTLVAGAAAMLTGMGDMMLAQAQHDHDGRVQIDPFRLVEAVIAGVAFIGAGTMIAHRGRVVAGITTAASLLMVAVIGVAVGFGHGWLALLATLLTFGVLSLLAWLERRVTRRDDAG